MENNSQSRAPIFEALEEFKNMRIVPFDVPGHKRGRGNKELTEFLGERCLTVDVNSMKPLDNLCHPVSVIKEAEEIAAKAFMAEHAFQEKYDKETIRKWLKVFIRRFHTQQFKRSAMPDGPKVGSISLSPRGDLRMPSDAAYGTFTKHLD